jgi:hypothetical protein
MKEQWKPVPYAPYGERYSISSMGRVRVNAISIYSKNKTEFLKPCRGKREGKGYQQVTLYHSGQAKCVAIHQMVALAFIGPPPFDGAIVCHKNDCKTDNVAYNLEWGTHKTNAATRELIGNSLRGEINGNSKLTEETVRAIRREYAAGQLTQRQLSERFGVCKATIYGVATRRWWKHVR